MSSSRSIQPNNYWISSLSVITNKEDCRYVYLIVWPCSTNLICDFSHSKWEKDFLVKQYRTGDVWFTMMSKICNVWALASFRLRSKMLRDCLWWSECLCFYSAIWWHWVHGQISYHFVLWYRVQRQISYWFSSCTKFTIKSPTKLSGDAELIADTSDEVVPTMYIVETYQHTMTCRAFENEFLPIILWEAFC